jgi:NADH:ubiquinone oxidoreductase subunit 2 (subunit N)
MILVFLGVAIVTGTAALTLRRWPLWSTAVALAGLAAMTIVAGATASSELVVLGGTTLAWSDWLRLFALLGCLTAVGLVVIDVATRHEPDVPGVIVLGLGATVLALTATDPATAAVAATGAGLVAVLVAEPVGAAARAASVGARELRALAVSGALALGATAWLARPLDQLMLAPGVFGLAYLAFAAAVAIRVGAIPFHLWAARVADAAPGVALPMLLVWGPAGLAAVAVVWIDRSIAPLALPIDAARSLVAAVGVLSVVFGLVAAAVQDDLEHVVGYTIAADAGFVVLALAGFDPDIWQPSRVWLLVFLVGRTALAAWAVAIHGAFGTRRLPELAGWGRRAPLLWVALLGSGILAVGWPGLVAWDARASILAVTLPAGLAAIVGVVPVAGLFVYGRLLVAGTRPASAAVLAGRSERPAWPTAVPSRRVGGRSAAERLAERASHAIAAALDITWALPAAIRLNRTAIASVVVAALVGLGAVVSMGGLGIQAAAAAPAGDVGGAAPSPTPGASGGPSAAPTARPTPAITFAPVEPGFGGSAPAG